jgi:phosphoglycerate dehydrogenase-like enzyme
VTTVLLPTAGLRERLAPHLPGRDLRVWAAGSGERMPWPADLVVLPYMAPPSALRALEGWRGLAQLQTLGYDGIAEHLPPGVSCCNAVGVHEASTAELALALILAMQRGIDGAVRSAAAGRWEHRRRPGLAGSRVLLIGVGGVGREIARCLDPFDAELTLVGRTARGAVKATAELPRLLPEADIVVVAVPLDTATRGLVDAAFLTAMRPGALLVNVSRGPVVDTEALVAAVRQGKVRAALDVTDPEPLPPDHPLWTLPDVLVTPHLGGDTDAMDARIDRIVIEQVRRLESCRPPLHLVAGGGR